MAIKLNLASKLSSQIYNKKITLLKKQGIKNTNVVALCMNQGKDKS